MNSEQKLYFILGVIYRMAMEDKEDGAFKDLSTSEVVTLFIHAIEEEEQ